MKLYSKQQMSESFLIGTLLAVVGGFLDAYTYIARGGVFANAQTGNIVLMGMNLAEGRWLDAFACFIPIFAFACGVFVDEWIRRFFLPKPVIHWRQIVILSEMLLLFIVAFLPLGGKYDLVANVLVSFVCSLQAQSFRKLHGLPYATTMCTGNLRSGTEHLFCFSPPAITESFCFLYLARESELCWQSSSGSFLSHSAISFCFWSAYCSLSAVKKTRNKSVHFRLR